ncbi:MAG: M28 family peptidase [Gammaproteobacteria bacterium]
MKFIVACALVVFAGCALAGGHSNVAEPANRSTAWFGIDAPEDRARRSNAARKAFSEPDLPPLSIRLPADEDPYRSIRGEEVMEYLEGIISVTRETRPEGEKFWGRIAGSRSEVATAEYMAEKFKSFGLKDVNLESVRGGKQWWPLEWEATLLGDSAYGEGTTDIRFVSAFPALQLGDAGATDASVEAELVYAGQGQPVDLIDRDLKGKIAVLLGFMQPDGFFQTARGHVDAVVEAGAAGVLIVMDAPGNHQYALEEMGPAHVPAFVLGGDDGRFLIDAMAAANAAGKSISARLSLKTEIRPSWEGRNVVATLPGKTEEWAIVISHLDGYFDAANDNGAGTASLLALARYFAEDAEQPNRNMMFVGTSAHHEFSDGATAFVKTHKTELDKSVAVMNIEHPASTLSYYRGALKFKRFTVPGQLMATTTHGTRGLNVSNNSPLIIGFYKEAIDRYGLVVDAMLERRPPTGDAIDFFRAGYTVMQILDSNIWYHSDGDLIDTIPPAGLARATRAYAEVLDKIDQHSKQELGRKR